MIGRSIATVATVPMPGSTPTSVPTSAPIRQKMMFIGIGNRRTRPIHDAQREIHKLKYDGEAETEILKQLEHVDLTAPGNAWNSGIGSPNT